MPNSARARILLVDDETDNLSALERTLRAQFDPTTTSSVETALRLVGEQDFAVIVSDQKMPEMAGTDLLAKVAKQAPLITRVILTAYTDTKVILDAINRAEIYRYITKPWDNQELVSVIQQAVEHHRLLSHNKELVRELETKNKFLSEKEKELTTLNQELENLVEQRTDELRRANAQLSELAMTDPLTALLNRRAFSKKIEEEIERSRRYHHPISVAMIDVDHFKPFNDMEGHLMGDQALKKIASILAKNIRKIDVVARYGGEEFVLLMPETKLSTAREICGRLRAQVENTSFQGENGDAFLTISIGIAGFPDAGDSAELVIQSADKALYRAKEAGRNRVETGP